MFRTMRGLAGIVSLLSGAPVAVAQVIESPPPPPGIAKPLPYLPRGSINYHEVIGPPPVTDSTIEDTDERITRILQHRASHDRWTIAVADDAYVYARFS